MVLSGVPILIRPNFDILGVRFNCMITFEAHMRSVVLLPENGYLDWGLCKESLEILLCYFVGVLGVLHGVCEDRQFWASSVSWGCCIESDRIDNSVLSLCLGVLHGVCEDRQFCALLLSWGCCVESLEKLMYCFVCVLRMVRRVFGDTSLFLRWYLGDCV